MDRWTALWVSGRWMVGWVDTWMGGLMDGLMGRLIYGCIRRWMGGLTDG